MKYCLTVRPFEEKDICPKVPFISSLDDFERYLRAFIEDIGLLDTIGSIAKSDESLDFIIETLCSKEELVKLIQDIHENHYQYERNIKLENLTVA